MKNLCLSALFCLPFSLIGQFTLTATTPLVQETEIPDDVVFSFVIKNDTTSTLRWRLFDSFESTPDWDDYVVELGFLGFTTNTRSFDIAQDTADSTEIDYHIQTGNHPGLDSGLFCVFDKMDSANTLTCLTVKLNATFPDTLEFYHDSALVILVDGDTFELYEGGYVPLSTPQVSDEITLSQNVPNPFHDFTRINFAPILSERSQLIIHNCQGRQVQSFELNQGQTSLTLTDQFEAGVYFYTLVLDGKNQHSKSMLVVR